MNDERVVQSQVLFGHLEGSSDRGGIGVLEFETEALTIGEGQQVQLGPALGIPEVSFAVTGHAEDFLQSESFPGRPQLGVCLQSRKRGEAQQGMQQAAVAEVNLGRSNLPLADIVEPGGVVAA